MRLTVTLDGETFPVEVVEAAGRYRVRLAEEWLEVDARLLAAGPASLLIGDQAYLVDLADENGDVVVTIGAETYRLQVEEAGRRFGRRRAGAAGAGQRLVAPMPGRVVAVHVHPGDPVEVDAPLVVLEAMKMENEFRATAGGIVSEVAVGPGQAVNAGDLLVVVGPAPAQILGGGLDGPLRELSQDRLRRQSRRSESFPQMPGSDESPTGSHGRPG